MNERFHARVNGPLLAVLGVLAVGNAGQHFFSYAQERGLGELHDGILFGFLGGAVLLMFRNRNRPVIEFDGHRLIHGGLAAFRRKTVDLTEVVGITNSPTWWGRFTKALRLQMNSGKTADVPLRGIPKEDQERIRNLLREESRAGQAP